MGAERILQIAFAGKKMVCRPVRVRGDSFETNVSVRRKEKYGITGIRAFGYSDESFGEKENCICGSTAPASATALL